MSELDFEVGLLRAVYSGQVRARLVPASESYDRMTVRPLRRIVVVHDPDGNAVGRRKETVTAGGDASRSLRLTVLNCEPVVVLPADKWQTPRGLTFKDARACGYRTVAETCDEWGARHPRQTLANLIWFALGDLRDRDVYLGFTGRGGGDYTRNPHRSLDPDAPALTPEQYENLGTAARQDSLRRRAETLLPFADETPEQRLERLEHLPARIKAEIRQELRIATQRISRAENRGRSH